MLQEVAILEGAGFMFSRVADKVSLLHPMVEDLVPFRAGGKTSPSTPA